MAGGRGRRLLGGTASSIRLRALALGGVAVVAWAGAVSGAIPPPGLNASASFAPVLQYVADASGVNYHFTIHNTGALSIGAVQIARPSGAWTVTSCTQAPVGWTTKRSGKACKYQSAAGTGDDIPAGASNSQFELRATTAATLADATGSWIITVSISSKFDGKSRFRPAAPEGTGLDARAYSFQIMDAAVADVPVGDPCPAASPANHSAAAGSIQTVVICGRNRLSGIATTGAAGSSIGGSFVAGSGTFEGGSVPAASGNVVLGRWTGLQVAASAGTLLDIVATIAEGTTRTSPMTTLDDACPALGEGEDCVDNGGYEAVDGGGGNTPPDAVDDSGAGFGTDEDTAFNTGNVLTNDTDADLDALTVQSFDAVSTKGGIVSSNADGTFNYNPNGQFESLNNGDSDSDTFTYTVSDGNGGTDTATVTIAISGVTDGGGDAAPTVTGTTPTNGATGVAVNTSIDVTFSESVAASGSSFTLECPGGGPAVAFSVTGSPGTTITVDPTPDLPAGTSCTVTVLAAGIADSDATDPPDQMVANFAFSFTTLSADVPPTAVDDGATVGEDAVASAIDVLANDTDTDGGPKNITLASDPANGTVVLTGGSPGAHTGLTYEPDDDFCNDPPGTTADTFTYTLNGGSTATVSVTVTCVDDAPNALGDTATVAEDSGANAIDVLGNDVDTDGGPMVIASASDPANGTVVLTGGSPGAHTGLTYQPDPDYCNNPPGTTDDFTYTLNGGDSATVAVSVTCANNTPPTAVNDSATVGEDAVPTAIDVLANDTDSDGGLKNIASASDPANGTVALTGGSPGAHTGLSYEPDDNFCNDPPGTTTDDFTYTLNGGSTATVSVTVTCVDDAPVVTTSGGSASYTEDGSPAVVDDGLTVVDVDGPSIASASVSISAGAEAGDTLAFTPAFGITDTDGSPAVLALSGTASAANYQAVLRSVTFSSTSQDPGASTRTISFLVDDGLLDSNTATRDVTVSPVNDDPTAASDSGAGFGTDEDSAFTTGNVLTNDSDPEGDTLVVQSIDVTGTKGLVTDNGDGTFGYDPNGQFESLNAGDSDTDTFTYTVSDGNGGTDTATVTIAISGVTDGGNGAPDAVDDGGAGFGTDEDTPFTTGNVLTNDSDPDLDTLTVQSFDATSVQGGLVTSNGDGTFGYDPNGLFEGLGVASTPAVDSFTYTISDGNGGTDTATVTISITGVNDTPTAVDDGGAAYTTTEAQSFTTGNVLGNDTDPDGDTLSVLSFDDSLTLGSVTNNGDGTFGYDPNGAWEALGATDSDVDTFEYTITDGNGGTDTAVVTITINGVNDAPDAVDDSDSTDEDTAKTIDPRGNDTDPDASDVLTIISVGTPTNGGTASIQNSGSQVQFDPGTAFQDLGSGQTRQSSFTYTISDGNGGQDTATVTFTVNGVNDAPVADDETFTGADSAVGNTVLVVDDPTDGAPSASNPKKSIGGDILAGDTDVDGPALSVSAGTFVTTDGGSVTIEADGDFIFTPAVGCTDTSDSFSYTVTDGSLTDVGQVTVNLSGCVWYVSNSAAGNSGTSTAPFDTLAQAEVASGASSTVFIFRGDGTATGLTQTSFTLDSNQAFVGEAQALVVGGVTLHPAGLRPNIAAGLSLTSANTVTGVALTANAVPAIGGGGGDVSGTIADVTIAGNLGGLWLQGTSGTWNISDVAISTTGTASHGLQVTSAGTVNFTSAGTISVSTNGSAGGASAVIITGTTTSGVIDSVTLSSSTATGINLDDNLGSLTIDDVNISTSGTGINVDSSNDVTINSSGDADVTAGGPAVVLTTITSNPANMPDVSLDQVSSTGGTAGILLNDIGNGTFSAAGGSLSGHTTAEIQIIGGSGNFTYPGPIGNGTGLSLDIQSHSAGTLTFAGSITDTNDAGGGINITNGSAAAVIVLSGQITLNTGAGNGFVAQDAGTLSVTNGANTIVSTTGTGVDISNTTISAANVTFRSVNVDGSDAAPVNGIRIVGTGALGHFEITGTGSAGTGGTIQDTSGNGIELINTMGPVISWMTVTSNLGNGIHGGNNTAGGVVNGATLSNLVVSNNGNDSGAEDGIFFQGLVGTASFANLNVFGSARHNVAVINNTGTLTSLTVTGSSIHDNAATSSNGLVFIADGTATMTASVSTTNFTTNRVTGVLSQTLSSGTLTVTVTGGTFTNNFVSVEFAHASTGSLTGTFTGGTITNAINGCSGTASPCGAPVNLFLGTNSGSAAGSILRATITNNTINNGGSANAPGIWMHTGTPIRGHARLLLTGNTITNVAERGIAVEGGGCNTVNVPGATCDGTVDATITGNTISLASAGASDAIHFNVGTAGTLAGHNDTLVYCAEINTNTLDTDGVGVSAVRMRVRSLTTIRLPGYTGGATDTTAVNTFLNGKNTEPDGDLYSSSVQAGSGGFQNTIPAGTACQTP